MLRVVSLCAAVTLAMIPALADAAGKAGTSLRHRVAAPPPGNNYYVAPGGNDAWSGTLTAPFRTLGRAKAAMRSSSIKKTYLRSGVYSIVSRLQFTSPDSNQALLAYPGEQPVLDGGGRGRTGPLWRALHHDSGAKVSERQEWHTP